MDPKLTMLFLLIGTIIGLSHYGDENVAERKRQLDGRSWRISQLRTHFVTKFQVVDKLR
jgi:hypothetical protein